MASNMIAFRRGALANLPVTRDPDTFYLTIDTHQMFLGQAEYTKGTKVINAVPTSSTPGEVGCLYVYNSNVYLCSAVDGNEYTYVRVATLNDFNGTVTSVAAGDGLETDVTGGAAITGTGTISHSIPSGATVTTDPTSDSSPTFGGTFTVQGIETDKFGHVTASNARTITLPTETAVSVEDAVGSPTTLAAGGTFAVVTGVEVGIEDQAIKETTTTFTLPPEGEDTTYTFTTSLTTDGAITVTPSEGSSYDVVIKGYDDLAKKSDIAAVFKFKGTKPTVAALPTEASVGDVWHVTEANAEYVCVRANIIGPPEEDAVWEELGSEIDLSAYALSADVIPRVVGEDNEVPKFKNDGTLESTGFMLGKSVPADAVFTDTTYSPVVASATGENDPGLMTSADKYKLDSIEAGADVNVIESISVEGTTLTVDANKNVDIELTDFGITATAAELNDIDDKLDKTDGGTVAGATTFSSAITATGGLVGDVTGDLTGTASMATADASGNVITTTYATKQEVEDAKLQWLSFD